MDFDKKEKKRKEWYQLSKCQEPNAVRIQAIEESKETNVIKLWKTVVEGLKKNSYQDLRETCERRLQIFFFFEW